MKVDAAKLPKLRIEAGNLPESIRPKIEELLFRLMLHATKLGIGLRSVSFGVCELGAAEFEGVVVNVESKNRVN